MPFHILYILCIHVRCRCPRPAVWAPALLVSCVLVSLDAPALDVPARAADRQYRFAAALAQRGDFERAAEEFRVFIEKFPPNEGPHDERMTRAGFWLGYCLHKAGKHDGAAEALREWTAANRTHELADRARYLRAESLAAAGRRTEARLEWRELTSLFPKSPRAAKALESLAWSYFDEGRHERALEYAREIGRRFAERKDAIDQAIRLAGECLLVLGRAEGALAEFDSLLARTPANELAVRARFGRAAALQDLERHDEAASEYAEVMKLAEEGPDLKALVPQAMLAQASSLVSAGKADEALKVIWLLELRGDRGAAGLKSKFWKGLAYEAKGQKAKASAAYEQVLSRPEAGAVHGRAAWQLADLRYLAGDKLGSVAAYDRLVALSQPAKLVDHALFNSAVTLDELGKTEDALSRINSLLRDHPESPLRADALYAAGEFLVRLERYRDAAGRCGEFLLRFPTDDRAADVRFRRGWCLNASGATDAARAELEKLLQGAARGDPAAEAALLLAEIARKDGRLDEAARHYEKAAEAAPESERAAEALLELSAISKDAGRAREAEGYARRLVAEHPDSPLVPLAEVRAADVALADGRAEEALSGYRSVKARLSARAREGPDAASRRPGRDDDVVQTTRPGQGLEPAALSGEAWALLELGRKDEALAAFGALARKHPDTRFGVEALYRSAVLLREEGRPAAAKAALARLLRLSPDGRFTQAALFEQALARKSTGDLEGAVAALREFERSFPRSDLVPEVLCQLALAHFERKDLRAERATWREILAKFPESPEVFSAHFGLGALAEADGDWETAAREYGLAAESARKPAGRGDHKNRPDAGRAALSRAECLVRLGRKAEAWSAFREVADAFPGSSEAPAALVRAAELALEGGDHAGAIPLLRRAEEVAPGSGAVLLGEALRKSGRHREALVVLEKYIEERPGTARADAPESRRATLELALARAALGQHTEAESLLRDIVAGPEDALAARAQYELGEMYFNSGRLREADRAFYQLVLLYPFKEWQAKGRFRLGRVNERLRDYARARAFYAELVRENPRSELARRSRERLEALGP